MLGLDKNKKYLLACSYGPDSMALFKLLLNEGYTFEVAHVNYNLREESPQETIDLSRFCEENSIKLHIFEVEKGSIKSNLEEVCRNIRYDFFSSILKEDGILLVAHNEDDHIETYLLQEQRNSIVQHYGLNEETTIKGMKVVRPLLATSKKDLEQLCLDTKTPFSIDKTNLEDGHERNKIRHNVVQKMNAEERQNIIDEIEKENEKLGELFAYIKDQDLENSGVLRGFNDKSLAIACHIQARKICSEVEISMAQIREIRKILESDKPNISIKVFDNVLLVKEYEKVAFVLEDNEEIDFCYILEKPGVLDTPYFYLDFTNGAEDRNITLDDYPLTIRKGKHNDVYRIKNYDKTLRRLFIDWKVPQHLRKRYPVILNNSGIIKFVPRYRSDFKVKDGLNIYLK